MGVALRREPAPQLPPSPRTQAPTCKNEDLYYVQGLVEPGRKAELSIRLGSLVPSLAGVPAFLPIPRTTSPRACLTLWGNKSCGCNGAQPGLPAAWQARLSASAGFGSQTWSPEHAPFSLPFVLVPRVRLASPARKQGPSLGWTFVVAHSAQGQLFSPKSLKAPPLLWADPTIRIRNSIPRTHPPLLGPLP